MATQPLFDPTRFDPGRVVLPDIELVRGLGKATDVVIGVAESNGRTTLVGAGSELESKAGKAGGALLGLLNQGPGHAIDQVTELNLPGLRVLAVGIGADLDLQPEDLRRAAGLGVRRALRADAAGQRRIVISLDAGTDAQLPAAQAKLLAPAT